MKLAPSTQQVICLVAVLSFTLLELCVGLACLTKMRYWKRIEGYRLMICVEWCMSYWRVYQVDSSKLPVNWLPYYLKARICKPVGITRAKGSRFSFYVFKTMRSIKTSQSIISINCLCTGCSMSFNKVW